MELNFTDNYQVIIQDYRTLKVLEIQKISFTELKKISINSFIGFKEKYSVKDQYIVKEILQNKENSTWLLKVKVNKESKCFLETTKFGEENKNPYSYFRK